MYTHAMSSSRKAARSIHKQTNPHAIPNSCAFVVSHSGAIIAEACWMAEALAKAKLATEVVKDSKFVQPVTKDKIRRNLLGARAAVHQ